MGVMDLGLVRGTDGKPGTANVRDDILSMSSTLGTHNGTPYLMDNEHPEDKKYLCVHGDDFGKCDTDRSNVAKVVDIDGYIINKGSRITVVFTSEGTENPASGNLLLNVNSTGYKPIVKGNTNKEPMTSDDAGLLCNNMYAEFLYDGEAWVIISIASSFDKSTIIDDVDEIDANEEEGMIAGALALKETRSDVNTRLGGVRFGITDDGRPGWVKSEGGADSVVPFKNGIFIPELKMSGQMSTYGTPLSNEATDITFDVEDYTSLTMTANMSASVGYVQLFVYDAVTSAILYQSTRSPSVIEDVSVDIANSSSIRIRVRIDGIGTNYGGSNSLTLNNISIT